jgi:hypothetical protein
MFTFASAALGLFVGVNLCDPLYPAGFDGCKLLGFINLKSGSYAFYSKKKLLFIYIVDQIL